MIFEVQIMSNSIERVLGSEPMILSLNLLNLFLLDFILFCFFPASI